MKKPSVRLEQARAELADLQRQAAEKTAARDATLLAGAAAEAIAEIDAAIGKLRHAERTEADRIRLLEIEAAKEAQQEIVRQQQAHIARFTKKLAQADAVARELQDVDVPQLLKKYRKIIRLRSEARMAFHVRSSHAAAAASSPEGCAMSGHAVRALLGYEFFRISSTPFYGGTPGEIREVSLPGAQSPNLTQIMLPDKVTPFADVMANASAFAVGLLKDEITAPVAADAPQPHMNGNGEPHERTDAEQRMAQLLKEQAEFAKDTSPAGEKVYAEIVAEISALSLELATKSPDAEPEQPAA